MVLGIVKLDSVLLTDESGQATGGINVSLKPNDASKSSTGGSGQPAMGG